MWSSLAKLTTGGSPGPRKKIVNNGSPTPKASPNGRGLRLTRLQETWQALQTALSATTPSPGRLSAVSHLLDALFAPLAAELSEPLTLSSATLPLGPCLEYLLETQLLVSLVTLCTPDNPPGARLHVIRWFKRAVEDLGKGFVANGAVHKPLMRLLRISLESSERLHESEEAASVELMAAICKCIAASPELLSIFFRIQSGPEIGTGSNPPGAERALSADGDSSKTLHLRSASPTPSTSALSSASYSTPPASSASPRRRSTHHCALFAFLLRFVHREGETGSRARASLLVLTRLAMSPHGPAETWPVLVSTGTVTPESDAPAQPVPPRAREASLALAEYILDSDFAEVLGAGVGALYGLLPSKLLVRAASSSTSAKGKETVWGDATYGGTSSGMVLGGMGSLGDETDPEEAQRHRDEEEDRLRALGVALSDSTNVRDAIDCWLQLVECVQDIVNLASSVGAASSAGGGGGDTDDNSRQRQLIASALAASVSASFRTLFLQSVMYPSILECSETDGSAVAVLNYLEALLGVVRDGSNFEDSVLSFLMGEEDVNDVARRNDVRRTDSSTLSVPRRIRRQKSNALVILENASPRAQANDIYFTSVGRFSLKDLLISNIHSDSPGTATSALLLLQTLLSRHDRWSLGLLEVVLQDGATSFPFVLREEDDLEETPPLDQPDISLSDESDSESDVFVYPISTLTIKVEQTLKTPSRLPSLLLGSPVPSTPSIGERLDSFHTLLAIVGKIDPAYRNTRAVGGGFEIVSTDFENYVQDAERTLAADLGFQRGLRASAEEAKESPPVSSQARRRSMLFGAMPILSARDLARAQTGYRHRLSPTSAILSRLLDSLARFFSHPPEVNLALTAVLASLAVSPYRSLEGWLLPQTTNVEVESELAKYIRQDRGLASDDGDDRSVDYAVDELGKQDAILSPARGYTPSRISARSGLGKAHTVLHILTALAASISQYRHTIPNFERYLKDRREGLMFSDNLADALDIGDGDGNAFLQAVRGLERRDSPTSLLAQSRPEPDRTIGSFLSPSPKPPTSNPFSTPIKSVRRQVSTSSLDDSTAIGQSPFAAHYRQTGSIVVTPVVVMGGTEEEESTDGPPDSPTHRLSRKTTVSTPSVVSELSDLGPTSKRQQASEVSLSVILDNVILLEEFVKELAGIVSVRRGLGIDGVRFVGTSEA